MDDHKKAVVKACLDGVEDNNMTFSSDRWNIDAGRNSEVTRSTSVALFATYYLPDGDFVEVATHKIDDPIAPYF